MGITEIIDRCTKIDSFENLNIGDYVRCITYNRDNGEWELKRGGYFKKYGINIKDIPYVVLYQFSIRKTFVINKFKILDDGTKVENIFFHDTTMEKKIPPIPKIKNNYQSFNNTSELDDKDYAILNLNEKVEDCNTEITYLKNKLKMFQKENKVLRMAVNKNKLI